CVYLASPPQCVLIFFTHTAPTELYTLSLHDALPILLDFCIRKLITKEQYLEKKAELEQHASILKEQISKFDQNSEQVELSMKHRSEEHTSELQSRFDLVCRLLLEKKKKLSCTEYDNI